MQQSRAHRARRPIRARRDPPTVPGVAYSCQQGFCGTCRTRVIAGEIDHRDRVLTDGERTDTMTICVSGDRSDLGEIIYLRAR
jgi:ferredoxin